MKPLQVANMVVAFAVEMWMLWAYAQWGIRTGNTAWSRWLLALGAPAVAIAIWAKWAAPKALTRLGPPWLWLLEWSMFALAAAAMFSVGRTRMSFAYLLLASVSIGLSAYDHRSPPVLSGDR